MPRARSQAETPGAAVTTQNGIASSSPPAQGSAQQRGGGRGQQQQAEHRDADQRVRPEQPRRIGPGDAAVGAVLRRPAARLPPKGSAEQEQRLVDRC